MSFFDRCNLTGSVCQTAMSLQSGYPHFLVVHVIGLINVKPMEMLKIGHVSLFEMF